MPIVGAKSIVDKMRKGFGSLTRSTAPVAFALDDAVGPTGGYKLPDGSEDLRTLWVDFDRRLRRYKELKNAVDESSQEIFRDAPDSCQGAPIALDACTRMLRSGGRANLWLNKWCHDRGITKRDRAFHEMKTICDACDAGATIDQVNPGGLLCLEIVARRLIAISEAHDAGSDNPNWSLARHVQSSNPSDSLMRDVFRTEVSRRAKDE